MPDIDKAAATQLANIEKRSGKTMAELSAIVKASGLSKHGELIQLLKTTLGMRWSILHVSPTAPASTLD